MDVSEYDNDYINAPKNNFRNLPDGTYQVTIDIARFETSQNGSPLFNFGFKVLNGKYANRLIFKPYYLQSEISLSWLKTDLEDGLKFPHESLTDLSKRAIQLLGINLEVTLSTKTCKDGIDRQNVYVNKRLDISTPAKAPTFSDEVIEIDDPYGYDLPPLAEYE